MMRPVAFSVSYDLQRHPSADGVLLFGHPHDSEAAFSDLLEELIRGSPYPKNNGAQRSRPAVYNACFNNAAIRS